jgi:hypothetical protein
LLFRQSINVDPLVRARQQRLIDKVPHFVSVARDATRNEAAGGF